MRITGGEFGGRNLKVPKSDAIRPTQDRVREAVFNIIQFEVAGSDFLDLFAGSGAVGLEAFSRGARSVTFVEANRRHLSVLKENLTLLCSTSTSDFASLVSADAYRWISTYAGPGFSIGFADPPYALPDLPKVPSLVFECGLLADDGVLVFEHGKANDFSQDPHFVEHRAYGSVNFSIFRHTNQQ